MPDHAALTGILFVLLMGIPWEMLPREIGCGSGVTCWRHLRDWQEVDVWAKLHRELLTRLHCAGRIDWSRACMDSSFIPAKRGAKRPVRTRRIVENRAQSATSSLTDRIFR